MRLPLKTTNKLSGGGGGEMNKMHNINPWRMKNKLNLRISENQKSDWWLVSSGQACSSLNPAQGRKMRPSCFWCWEPRTCSLACRSSVWRYAGWSGRHSRWYSLGYVLRTFIFGGSRSTGRSAAILCFYTRLRISEFYFGGFSLAVFLQLILH